MSGPTPLTGKLRVALEEQRGVSIADASELRVLSEPGQFADRPVTLFRIFDPGAIGEDADAPRHYGDLATSLILHSGHIDANDLIVLDSPIVMTKMS